MKYRIPQLGQQSVDWGALFDEALSATPIYPLVEIAAGAASAAGAGASTAPTDLVASAANIIEEAKNALTGKIMTPQNKAALDASVKADLMRACAGNVDCFNAAVAQWGKDFGNVLTQAQKQSTGSSLADWWDDFIGTGPHPWSESERVALVIGAAVLGAVVLVSAAR